MFLFFIGAYARFSPLDRLNPTPSHEAAFLLGSDWQYAQPQVLSRFSDARDIADSETKDKTESVLEVGK